MRSILVLGQTPPPFGGQAMMIQRMLEGRYRNAKLYHVRMSFSKSMDDMGRWRLGKLLHVFNVVAKVAYLRLRHGVEILYFPPSGPDRLPMLRDLVILSAVRWMFKKTIFHFHAAGTSELYAKLPSYLQTAYRHAYFRPDLAIQLSEFNPDDGKVLQARMTRLVPNGLDDENPTPLLANKRAQSIVTILFVGLVSESKGILVLIDAVGHVKKTGQRVKVNIVGQFASEEFRQTVMDQLNILDLTDEFDFKGVKTGRAKCEEYLNADIFCFPTFFESESFGLVVVEAMQFCLPVIATKWRGVQSLVQDGENGFQVAPHDSHAVADRILALANAPDLRKQMGNNGRELYLEKYTLEQFHKRMDECFAAV